MARLAASVVVSVDDTGLPMVLSRRPGELARAPGGVIEIGLELEPWCIASLDDVADRISTWVAREGVQAVSGGRGLLDSLPSLSLVDPGSSVKAALAAMRHFPDNAKVVDLAHGVGWSERSFRRHLTKSTGLGAGPALRILRSERARTTIASGMPLSQVATLHGFADQSHLNREFHRWCGYSPAQWAQHTTAWTQTPPRPPQDALAE